MPTVYHHQRQVRRAAGVSCPPAVLAVAERMIDSLLDEHHRFGRVILCEAIYDRTGRLTDRSGDAEETLKHDQACAGIRRHGEENKA